VRRLAPLATGMLVLAGCGDTRFFAPEPASEEAEEILGLWRGTFITAIVVGALVLTLIVVAVIVYRRPSDDVPRQGAHNTRLEVIWTTIPIVIVAVIFGFNVLTTERVTDIEDPELEVDVTGFQWQWQFSYPDEDVTVTGETGRPAELVLPVDRRVRFNLNTVDVIHAFWVPEFFNKLDLIPGVDNRLELVPNREGTYTGRCTEFCGLDHWRMTFTLRVVSQDEFEDWLAEQGASTT
jgi:cytochrome c oxidase subunit 2